MAESVMKLSSSQQMPPPVLDQAAGERRAVDRRRNVVHQMDNRSNMVFVPVRQHHRAHVVAVLQQVADVGHHDVHAQQLDFGEHQAGVDHNDVVAVAEGEHIHSELA